VTRTERLTPQIPEEPEWAASIEATDRSTSSSSVRQLQTEIRIAAVLCQTVDDG
jgi:hypothetical protein